MSVRDQTLEQVERENETHAEGAPVRARSPPSQLSRIVPIAATTELRPAQPLDLCSLVIEHLDFHTNPTDIRNVYSTYGPIRWVDVRPQRQTRFKIATVIFADENFAEIALNLGNSTQHEIHSHRLHARYASRDEIRLIDSSYNGREPPIDSAPGVDLKSLHLANLDDNVTEAEIYHAFRARGHVFSGFTLPPIRKSAPSRIAFADFATHAESEAARVNMDGFQLHGRTISVQFRKRNPTSSRPPLAAPHPPLVPDLGLPARPPPPIAPRALLNSGRPTLASSAPSSSSSAFLPLLRTIAAFLPTKTRPKRVLVAGTLSKSRTNFYASVGFADWKSYAKAAEAQKLVEMCANDGSGREWIALADAGRQLLSIEEGYAPISPVLGGGSIEALERLKR